jgi:hypothetical protein
VFRRRMAGVVIRDTKGPAPYSVVGKILEWETGHSASQLVNQSHSQGRHHSKPTKSDGWKGLM